MSEGRETMPNASWWWAIHHPTFPVSFGDDGVPVDYSSPQTVFIIPRLFSTAKAGSYLNIKLRNNDSSNDATMPSITGRLHIYSYLDNNNTPIYGEQYELFPGSSDLHYYPNRNVLTGADGNKTMTLADGNLQIRITTEILSKLQSYGIQFNGYNYTLNGVSLVDPFAIFPGQGATTALTVPVRSNYSSGKSAENAAEWWQNAIVLDPALFADAHAGDVIHVYTSKSPDDTSSSNPYTGYPSVGTEMTNDADNTSQVYLQCFTGTTASPGNGDQRYIDRGWDYMSTDAYFVLSDDDLEKIRDAGHTTQLIINGGTIRKVSIDPAWNENLTFQLSSERKSMPDGTEFTIGEEESGSETGTGTGSGTGSASEDTYTYRIYLENLRSLQPHVGDVLRLSMIEPDRHNLNTGEKPFLALDYYGRNSGNNVTWSSRGGGATNRGLSIPDGLGHSTTDIANNAMTASIVLDEADIAAINNSDHSSDDSYGEAAKGDQYFWLAIKAMGMTISGVYLDKKVMPQHHVVELSEDDETTSLRTEPNVDVHLKRKLTAGRWSTIMLPFALNSQQIASAFGPHVTLGYIIESSLVKDDYSNYWAFGDYESLNGKEYILVRCTAANRFYSNMPMIIKIAEEDKDYIKDPDKGEYYEFDNVDLTLRNDYSASSTTYANGYIQHAPLFMVGTYSVIPQLPKYAIYLTSKPNPHHHNEMRQDFYYVGDNTIKGGGVKIKGYRWYMFFSTDNMHLDRNYYDTYFSMDTSDGKATGLAKCRVRFLLDDKDITIQSDGPTASVDGITADDKANDWQHSPVYSLSGNRIAGSLGKGKLAPGIYIAGGHKVVIK